jgi:hypothetical protein
MDPLDSQLRFEDGSAELGHYARNLVSDAVRRGILLPAPA